MSFPSNLLSIFLGSPSNPLQDCWAEIHCSYLLPSLGPLRNPSSFVSPWSLPLCSWIMRVSRMGILLQSACSLPPFCTPLPAKPIWQAVRDEIVLTGKTGIRKSLSRTIQVGEIKPCCHEWSPKVLFLHPCMSICFRGNCLICHALNYSGRRLRWGCHGRCWWWLRSRAPVSGSACCLMAFCLRGFDAQQVDLGAGIMCSHRLGHITRKVIRNGRCQKPDW